MLPAFRPGTVVAAWTRPAHIMPGDIVIFRHDGKEKIKRIQAIKGDRMYVVGDHPAFSSDSREFGWINRSAVVAKVWWPRTSVRGVS